MAIGSILTALGLAALKGEAKAAARRVGRRAAFAATTIVLLVLAFSFGLAALTVWLAGLVGVIWALLIIAAAMLVLALIVQFIAYLSDRNPPRRQRFRPQMAAAADLGQAASDEDAEAPTGSAVGSLAVIAVVGFVLARQLFKR